MSDFTIVEDAEPMTYDKVSEFIECLFLSDRDRHELRSMVAELMLETRKQEQDFVENKCRKLGIDYTLIFTCESAD